MQGSDSLFINIWYIIFWGSVAIIVYNYFLYPVILIIARKLTRNRAELKTADFTPRVTLIISAFNEDKVIGQKIENALSLDYPRDRLEVLVVSDASTDKTDAIVREWEKKDARVRLLRMPERRGKTAGLNRAVQEARGEILVFSDANAIYNINAIKELVKYFQRPDVGYVVGKAVYLEEGASPAGNSEGLYWKYELWLKELESDFHSVVGGDGAIYAIRKELFDPLQEDDINDFVNPLQIIAKGFRGVFNPRAVCYEYAADQFEKEYNRKRRIVNRSWRAFKRYLHLFSWSRHGKFLFLLFSHKVIRWFNWVFLAAIYISTIIINIFINSPFYRLILLLELLFVALALIGYVLDKKGKSIPTIFYLPYYYHLINLAALGAFIDDLRGKKYVKWEHVRAG